MKYIDKEKLIAEIERLRKNACTSFQKGNSTEEQYYLRYGVIQDILSLIDSLQQEQKSDDIKREWWNKGYFEGRKNAHIPARELGLPSSWDFQQEQPKVDLENYLENYFKGWYIEEEIGLTKPDGWSCIVDDLKDIARHFYEHGLNARKEK